MDGEDPNPLIPPSSEVTYTRSEALRTLAFWSVTAALACHSLVVTGITFHIVDLGASAGLPRTAAVQVFLPMAIVSTAVGFLGGVLADRVPLRALMVIMVISEALGIVGAADLSTRAELAILGLGVGGGLFLPISTVAYPQFFGRRHLGAIVGVEMMLLVIASALGPSLLATSQSLAGSYRPGLQVSLIFPLAALALILAYRRPV